MEYLIWVVVALLVGYKFVAVCIAYLFSPLGQAVDVASSGGSALGAASILLFPIIIRQIFGAFPLQLLEQFFRRINRIHINMSGLRLDLDSLQSEGVQVQTRNVEQLDPRQLLSLYGKQTSDLAKDIYRRSNVYILTGVIISLSGLVFFYFRYRDLPTKVDYVEHVLGLLPGFGILFFIEFVAFFFLRQYRSAMDDFRYFDAVRRSREDSLVVLKMFEENRTEAPTKDVLAVMNIYSSAGHIGKDETTERLEARRMERDESAVFERLIDTINDLKKAKAGRENK